MKLLLPNHKVFLFKYNVTKVTDEEKTKTVVESLKSKGIDGPALTSKFKKYDEAGKGKVPLDVFYVVFMRSGVVLTNKEVELLAKQWDPEVVNKNEIDYMGFLQKYFS